MIQFDKRKSLKIWYSGRSTDYVAPSFGFGCLYDCSYCYMKRHGKQGVSIANNSGDILTKIWQHAHFEAIFDDKLQKPNQTDESASVITYDISCNEDFSLHAKFHEWQKIFQFAVDNDNIKFSLATKYVNKNLLTFDAKQKVRIRFSLMPQRIANQLEPNTSLIIDRIKAVDQFIAAGYEVHLNFSPVVVYQDWLEDYQELFDLCNEHIKNKDKVKCEVIFLTHSENKHIDNTNCGRSGEHLLYVPALQEAKVNKNGASGIRYSRTWKPKFINQFKELHKSNISWCTIRYIF